MHIIMKKRNVFVFKGIESSSVLHVLMESVPDDGAITVQ